LLLLVSYGCAITLVARVVKVISLGITYALWSGIGTLAVVPVGALIVAGVVIMNLGGVKLTPKQ